ncbi:MAG: hypothetical protein CTR53_20720, partial [Ferrovibrio sp.]
NAFHSNTASLTVGVGGGTSAFSGRIIDGGSYNGVECAAVSLTKQGGGIITLTGDNDYGGVTEVVVGELSLGGSLRSSVTVRSGGVLSSSGGRGATSGRVDVESGGTIHGGREAGALTVGELVLQDGAALDAYASGASVSKIISTSAPRVGALTVRLKNAMSAGAYALIEGPGNGSVSAVVTGENLSALYCVRYAWENGVKMTANNNTSIREGVLSGGGLLADASSSGLSAALQPSERGVTYHLFKTSNGVVSEAGAKEGTGGVLIFENLGAGVYSAKGSKDGCLRPMSGTVVISVDARAVSKGWLAHSIPEAVKATLERDAPTGKSSHFLFKDLYPSFRGKVIGSCEDTCRYYAGFQLSCDGSDFNTAVRWAAQLSLSLKKPGFPAVKLSDSLKADLGAQTFESTTFFDQTLRCEDDYEFIIDHASAKGNVPPGAVRLVIRLFKAYHAQMDPSAAVGESNFHVASAGQSASLSWSCAAPGAEEYDLEWVFIDACDGFSGSREEAFAFLEPVRVTVKGMEYSRTLYYPSGNVYYRIRPVGRQKLNPSRRTEGAWTYKGPFASTNHDESRTWQWQTVFSEEGKHKKSMSYYDATGRLRQQSVNLSSEGATLTGETLYDFEGRKSVEVMPVPSLGNSLSHKSNLNPFLAGAEVSGHVSPLRKKYHYDNGRTANSVLDSASSGAGRYYSSLNDIEHPHKDAVPRSGGYAYSQTEYTRDGTGRISRQGGVGKELRIDGPRAARHYYGSASQEELRRLFGDKIGKASHYKKDVMVDANGQASVFYKDQEGRTAATALAGGSPSNAEELASFAAQTGTPVTLRLDEKNS